LLVGAKHLEDKLSVIAKNSSPNASPVQLSVVSCQLSVVEGRRKKEIGRVEGEYYFPPLSVKSGRATFTAPSFRCS